MLEEPREHWKALFANKIPPTPQPLQGQIDNRRPTVGQGAEAVVNYPCSREPFSPMQRHTHLLIILQQRTKLDRPNLYNSWYIQGFWIRLTEKKLLSNQALGSSIDLHRPCAWLPTSHLMACAWEAEAIDS